MSKIKQAVIRECQNPDCKFRFPDINYVDNSIFCPKCNSIAVIQEKIDLSSDYGKQFSRKLPFELVTILDNIRSVHNVGAIFRTTAGFSSNQIYLCGITPTPNHPNFVKTSLGAEKSINWEYSANCIETCISLKNAGYTFIAIENTANAISIVDFGKDIINPGKFALVLGNELSGIDPGVLKLCENTLSIPIFGENKSYNVTSAYAIAMYHFCFVLLN